MKVKVTGFSPVDFEKDGKQIVGVNIHYVFDDPANENLKGKAVDKKWVNAKIAPTVNFPELLTAELCEIEFNQKGQLIDVYPSDKKASGF